jgi:hypothetical protein
LALAVGKGNTNPVTLESSTPTVIECPNSRNHSVDIRLPGGNSYSHEFCLSAIYMAKNFKTRMILFNTTALKTGNMGSKELEDSICICGYVNGTKKIIKNPLVL